MSMRTGWARSRPERCGPGSASVAEVPTDTAAVAELQARMDTAEHLQTVVLQRTELLAAQVRDLSVLTETVGPLTALEDQQAALEDQQAALRDQGAGLEDRLTAAEPRVDALESGLTELVPGVAALGSRVADVEAGVGPLAARVASAERWLRDLDARLAALEDAQSRTWAQLEDVHGSLRRHAMLGEVSTVMQWIQHISLPPGPLVSVVLPTHDRAGLVGRAVGSVLAQTYPNWELLIVDDGSVDDTPEVLAAIVDGRVRVRHIPNSGVCAARNAGLELVRGDIVAYLDDDNVMHPEWLKSVVWRFGQEPATDVVWGAIVVDDLARVDRRGHGDLPRLSFLPYDRQLITSANIADIGAIAHRAGLPEGRFDETLREMGDWDLFLRLTRDKDPLPLPAIACLYTTDGPDRLSHGPTYDADLARVQARNQR